MDSPLSMYERAMGERYSRLDRSVRRLHRLSGKQTLRGWVETDAPSSLTARLLALFLGTPTKSARGPVLFEIEAGPDGEVWTRRFPSKTTTSRLRLADGSIVERHGPARLTFEVHETVGALEMRLVRLHLFGIPMPRVLMPQITAEEIGHADLLQFRVEATLPRAGVVASYRGHLELPSANPPAPSSESNPA